MVSLRNIEKYYGEYHALRDVSVDIAQGEFFSLLGPSGCGKTTLLRTIAGFEDVTSGEVAIAGQEMAGVPANRRPTNMVFQSYAIFPHLSVAKNVAFGLRRRADIPKQSRATLVEDALNMVGLDGYGARRAHALSGGQRQRVALARALILKPKVLLLDEPLSALDKKMREQMQSELRRLQRHVGITFILVTHDQEEALTMSDRIAVMFEGRIAQMGSPEALYRRPETRAVAEFIGMMTFLEGRAASGTVEVEGLGRAEIAAPEGAVAVGVRPETLTLLAPGETAARETAGTVADRAYYGDMTYYDIALPGTDTRLTVSMKNRLSRAVLEPGTEVRLGWEPDALLVYAT
ncbi:MAG: ABC transporter ATP-binding protein [Paracoccaceae bacterium]|nr:ABC transporter ATP-binding protein [Paracoccaceae bacterium]